MRSRFTTAGAALLSTVLLAGCGSQPQPDPYPLTGTWELKGFVIPFRTDIADPGPKYITASVVLSPATDTEINQEKYQCTLDMSIRKPMTTLDIGVSTGCQASRHWEESGYKYRLLAGVNNSEILDAFLEMNYEGETLTGRMTVELTALQTAWGSFVMQRVARP